MIGEDSFSPANSISVLGFSTSQSVCGTMSLWLKARMFSRKVKVSSAPLAI